MRSECVTTAVDSRRAIPKGKAQWLGVEHDVAHQQLHVVPALCELRLVVMYVQIQCGRSRRSVVIHHRHTSCLGCCLLSLMDAREPRRGRWMG